jgi:hypothetical protein
MTIEITVSSIVRTRPCSTWCEKKKSPTTLHWKCGLVTALRTSANAIRTTSAAATQRPGRRTGTALICSGGALSVVRAPS